MNYFAWRDLIQVPWSALISVIGLAILVFAYLLLAALSDALVSFRKSESPVNTLVLVEGRVVHPESSRVDPGLAGLISTQLSDQVERLSPVIFRVLRIEDHVVQVRGTPVEDWEGTFGLRRLEGRWPDGADEVAIGAGTSHFTGWEHGDTLMIYGSQFDVVGTLNAPGSKFLTVWMPFESARDLFGAERGVQMLVVRLAPGADPLRTQQRVEALVQDRGAYSVYLEDALLQDLARAMEDLRGLSSLITWIAIAAVTLGAYNLTHLAADGRRRTLGLLRAVGFRPRSIQGYLLTRMTILVVAAYALALAAAAIYLSSVQSGRAILLSGTPLSIHIDPQMAALGLLLTAGSSLLGTWISARQVLATPVVELLGRGPGGPP